MKLFIRILPLLFMSVMINCSKSSSPGISIAGTWNVTSESTSGCTDASSNNSQIFACPATESNSCQVITFKSNGTFTSVSTYVASGTPTTTNINGTYSISGNKISTVSSGSSSSTDTFALSGNILTIISSKNSTTGCVFTIVMTK